MLFNSGTLIDASAAISNFRVEAIFVKYISLHELSSILTGIYHFHGRHTGFDS